MPNRERTARSTTSRSTNGRWTKAAFTSVVATVLALAGATPAAAGVTVSFVDAAGVNDPVAEVGRTVTVSGAAAVSTKVYVRHRPVGGPPCAPSAAADPGKRGIEWFAYSFYGERVYGDFTLQATGTWPDPGALQFCIWLADADTTPAVPIEQIVTFRPPRAFMSATITPSNPRVDEPATITIAGASEAPKGFYATIRRAGGAPCSVSYNADSGRGLVPGPGIDGAFTFITGTRQSAPGVYLICMWIADSGWDAAPVAGPQALTFTVGAPPAAKRCRVPRVTPGMRLAAARTRLRSAHCVPGRVRRVSSSRRRGRVVGFTPGSGTVMQAGAVVGIRISRGRR